MLSYFAVSAYALAHAGGDYHEVRDFLYPVEDCAPPCWQGIRPGVTDSISAVDTLRSLPWVTSLYSIQGIVINDSYISWKWNGQQPAMVDSERDGRIWFHNGLVYSIEIPLVISFAGVWGAFGAPESETAVRAPFFPPKVFYRADYLDGTLQFNSTVACPPNAEHLLAARVDASIAIPQAESTASKATKWLSCLNAQR